MLFNTLIQPQNEQRRKITTNYRKDETKAVADLLQQVNLTPDMQKRIASRARQLIEAIRQQNLTQGQAEALFVEYPLNSSAGIALMSLAEALLRIPDHETADHLIQDKLTGINWNEHTGQSEGFFSKLNQFALAFTGKILKNDKEAKSFKGRLKKWVSKGSEPIIRTAVNQQIKSLSHHFVLAETTEAAMKEAKKYEEKGYLFSYDMLGESAFTQEDAERYFESYQAAILKISEKAKGLALHQMPAISIKLSALHPRYEFAQKERVLEELTLKLFSLIQSAKQANMGLMIDAELAEHLDLSLDLVEKIFADAALGGWQGFGIVVQAYQKRAPEVIDWIIELAKKSQRRIPVRLVKGAYWDTEIKLAQMQGLEDFPVYTRKGTTDVSYLCCAQKILKNTEWIYPQFATHNAYTVATIVELAGDYRDFEFQCLYGMGYSLYEQVTPKDKLNIPCRIYAPIGHYEDLLPYLVRRILENGANSAFVNQIFNHKIPVDDLIQNPITLVENYEPKVHPKISLPNEIFTNRLNSKGLALTDVLILEELQSQLIKAAEKPWSVAPIVCGHEHIDGGHPVYSPNQNDQIIGKVKEATKEEVETALQAAHEIAKDWANTPVSTRAHYLEKTADLFEQHRSELMTLLIREAGKTIPDALSEVREATDFCRYYAQLARSQFENPVVFKGYTGEHNEMIYRGRGIKVCISPWNFPLAIFTGQVVAALAAGNCVLAKPAGQTPLVAGLVVRLLHVAGVPANVLHLLPGKGSTVGQQLISDERIAGVIFTGSTETAKNINQTLAGRQGSIVPFIAETGGQNAMIVDSSALPEQVVRDVIRSAFGSAGQRCSALRVLFLQEDIADKVLKMLIGAVAELQCGDPSFLRTDCGPVIDANAKKELQAHAERMNKEAKLLYKFPLKDEQNKGHYFSPHIYELNDLSELTREVFGPILHVIRYKAKDLDRIIASINATGYGLTLGIHSRIESKVTYIQGLTHVGNCYVNRNMIGAVVGLQPFGGERLSGTGPKAGGPNYLLRLCHERSVCVDTTAAGGNASLITLED
ncbi:MAG: bifunctional proline dehydrogenase/L-glutamate gamma-semialdehyde dehydrogenase PutA [Proteobacteria bacterium]|nr:bifunctional proline dehydrogenase/L-glutamate gamma-semialdehyde dehydrogenase PutA [Pseudomonadota bacterium]